MRLEGRKSIQANMIKVWVIPADEATVLAYETEKV